MENDDGPRGFGDREVHPLPEGGCVSPTPPLSEFEQAILSSPVPVAQEIDRVVERCECGQELSGQEHRRGADCLVSLRGQVLAIVDCLTRSQSRDDLASMLRQSGFDVWANRGA